MSNEHLEIVQSTLADPQAGWSPVVGPETTRLLESSQLDDEGAGRVLAQSVEVLSRCAGPESEETRTGLVVGYVQSGKTLSFTTVIALARDNGFPLVVLLAGTKENLHDQTADRLSQDLAVERSGGMSPWAMHANPIPAQAQAVAKYIASMRDQGVPEKFRRATVLTVMKNRTRLRNVRDLLEALPQYGVDVATMPVLVIDDEADQAGLNAAVHSDVQETTATYQAIVDLRAALPRHTYLMYTATPQANLLINLADVLSPDFVSVLKPGDGYTGGEYFFELHRDTFVKRLSDTAVTEALSPSLDAPPAELKRALGTFYLVVANRGGGTTVSMLVHPSHTTNLHGKYKEFVDALSSAWQTVLQKGGEDAAELIGNVFAPAYDDLVAGDAVMKPLDELLKELPHWIGATQVRVVNSGTRADSDISWNASPSWVLIGGNKLDRGFTVEGLAVTYMPRRVGVGQVDSVQQRARFFGYKSSYGLMCRAWLNGRTADAFEHYVEHEKLLRAELVRVAEEGTSLKAWKRKMLLDASYKPTRRAVIDLPYLHDRIKGDSWMSIGRVPGSAVSSDNLTVVSKLVDRHADGWVVDDRDPRSEHRHVRALVPMEDALELLADWKGHPDDVALVNQAALLLRARLDDDPSLQVDVYRMDGGWERSRTPSNGAITLQQGRAPKGPYPGDAAFFSEGITSIQIHQVAVVGHSDNPVIGLSLRLPAPLAGAVIVQVD